MRLSFLLLIGALLLGCASDGTRPIDPSVDLSSPDGTRRACAVQAVGASGDQRYVPELIPMLDDDDSTIRLQVGAVLKELTDFDSGYQPFANRAERSDHVQRWEAWWAEKSAVVGSTPPAPADAGSQP